MHSERLLAACLLVLDCWTEALRGPCCRRTTTSTCSRCATTPPPVFPPRGARAYSGAAAPPSEAPFSQGALLLTVPSVTVTTSAWHTPSYGICKDATGAGAAQEIETGRVQLVYKRRNGGVGLLKPTLVQDL